MTQIDSSALSKSNGGVRKNIGSSPVRSPVRIAVVVTCCLIAMAAVQFQQKQTLANVNDHEKGITSMTTAGAASTARTMAGAGTMDELGRERLEEPVAAAEDATEADGSEADTDAGTDAVEDTAQGEFAAANDETDENGDTQGGLMFDQDHPVFVLSLPHSADLVIPRYFECGGVEPGKYWTKPNPAHKRDRRPIGQCMLRNLQDNDRQSHITQNCGKFKVWTELSFFEPPLTKTSSKHEGECFDPVLYGSSNDSDDDKMISSKALHQLQQDYPKATILTIQMDPIKWYQNVPKDTKFYWRKFCNPTHKNAFPKNKATEEEYVQFYTSYYKKIQDFVDHIPGWEHVVVQWDEDDQQSTGEALQEQLGIQSQCWTDATDRSMIQPVHLETAINNNDDPELVPRPINLNFPLLVASLPKSGTASMHEYFKCGLGNFTRQHWTTPTQSTIENPLPNIQIGKCILENVQAGRHNILKNCGHVRVFNDIGYISAAEDDHTCFYPSFHGNALHSFAKAYPRGTILQVLRNPTDWYRSAKQWGGNLLERWSRAECEGFPPPQSTQEVWEDFYHHHNNHVRTIAKMYPDITYIEVPLSANTGDMLHNIFGFHANCWGHANQFGSD